MHDFSKWKCRASRLGALLVEPKDATAKKAGELSETAKAFLINAYVKEKYGREEDFTSKQTEKGKEQEQEGASLFSEVEGRPFKLHKEYLENDYFTGHIDLYCGENIQTIEECWDIKCPWSMNTFLANLTKPLNRDYWAQIQVYYNLLGCGAGGVAYTLVNASETQINDELFYLAKRMGVIDVSVPPKEYIEAAAKLEYSMRFDDVDPKDRVLKFPVVRDDEFIEKAKGKVEKARIFLQELEQKHLSFNEKKD